MSSKTKRLFLTGGAAAALIVLLLVMLIQDRTPVGMPLPNPNGYDDFLRAATAVTGDIYSYSTLSNEALRKAALRDVVAGNHEALALLHLGLTRQCSVNREAAVTNVPAMLGDLAKLKQLAQLVAAEGKLCETDNQPAEAALIYADIILFGNKTSRGGFIINRLSGIACEAIGCDPLARLAPKLNPQEARAVLAKLQMVENVRVAWDEVLQNERRFSAHILRDKFNPITWAMTRWEAWSSHKRSKIRHNRVIAHERLLLTELALRCYRVEKSRGPASLDELVPNYLQTVPLDPFSNQPLIYRPQGTNWLLYSVGIDRVDNGGKPANRGLDAKGDIFFDSPW